VTAAPPAEARPARSALPSVGDIIFLALLFLLLARLPNFVFADASTGWHLVTGQYIIDNLRVPHRDLISYTFPDKPWVAYEWLFDAVAALLVRAGGLPLLAVVIASAIAFLFALLYRDARRAGLQFQIALVVTLVGAVASSVHWLARPEIFTFFGVYIFARCLEALHRNQVSAPAAAAALGATMLVWANAHPAFILGLGMILIYAAAEALAALTGRVPSGQERRTALAPAVEFSGVALTAAAASLINPNGASLYPYIAALLRATAVRYGFAEWMSPVFHGDAYAVALELLFAIAVIGLAASRRRLWLGQLLVLLAFAHFALEARRNVPLFVIVAVPAAASLLAAMDAGTLLGAAGGGTGWAVQAAGRWKRLTETFDDMERRCTLHIAPIAAVIVLAASCVAAAHLRGVPALVHSGFDPTEVPTTALAEVSRAGLPWNRGFAMDNWGGYIRYETGHRVFIDDRPDFYGTAFYERYIETIAARPKWNKLLDDYRIQWVLVPKNVPLVVVLRQAGWRLDAEDRAAYLFVHGPYR
jgi:hypothetical protein